MYMYMYLCIHTYTCIAIQVCIQVCPDSQKVLKNVSVSLYKIKISDRRTPSALKFLYCIAFNYSHVFIYNY